MQPNVRTVSPDWHPLGVIVEDSLTAALMDLKHVSAPLSKVKGGGPLSGSGSSSTAPASSETTSTSSSLAGTRSYVTPDDIAAIAERAAELIDEESWEEALKFVIEEHDLTSRAYGNMDDRTLQALSTYAGVLWQLGRGSDTRELLEELVDRRTQAVASMDPKAGADELTRAQDLLADALLELCARARCTREVACPSMPRCSTGPSKPSPPAPRVMRRSFTCRPRPVKSG
jgi:hypothetical protein